MTRRWEEANGACERLGRKAMELLRENAALLTLAIVVGAFAHGFELTHTTLSLDEEVMWQMDDHLGEWLAQRRWGMYLAETLLIPKAVHPFTSAALSVLFLALASVIFARRLRVDPASAGVFCVLFVSFPTFAHILCFAYMASQVAVAVFLVVLAETLFAASGPRRWMRLVGALCALTVATACHQSLIFIFPTLVLLALTVEAFQGTMTVKAALSRIAGAGAFAAAAVALFYTVCFAFRLKSNGYAESNFLWGTSPPAVLLDRLFQASLSLFKGASMTYALVPTVLVPAVALIVAAERSLKTRIAAVLTILTLLSPLAVHLAFGNWMSSRSMMALPFAFAGLWAAFFFVSPAVLRLLILGFTWYAVVFHSSALSRASLDQEMTYKSDSLIASRLLDLIYTVQPRIAEDRTGLVFVGRIDPRRSRLFDPDEAFGASFWASGYPYRMLLFLKALGVPKTLTLASDSDWPKAAKLAEDMPAWPDKDCVQLRDGMVVVKLSAP